MGPGGVTEIIAHFVGLFRIPEDYVRARLDYDGGGAVHPKDWTPDREHHLPQGGASDEIASQPFRLNLPTNNSSLIKVPLHHLPVPHLDAQPHPFHVHTFHMAPVLPVAGATGAIIISGSGSQEYLDLSPTPDQALISVTQVNFLQNDHTILMVDGTAVTSLHDPETAAHFQQLIATAQAEVPGWLPQDADTQAAMSSVTAHDAALAHGKIQVSSSLHAGVTIDGALQPDGTVLVPPDPILPDTTFGSHNGMLNPGLDAQTGGNLSLNFATIVDVHTQHTGLAIYGNAYTTNAIVQLNVFVSSAQIDVAGPTSVLDIITDGNVTSNGASFATHDLGANNYVGHFAPTANVHVDRIDGDFYDIKALQQINWLSNNDTIVQATWSSYYAVDSGHNTQINDLQLNQLADSYDLIIVQGSWHTSNIILQQNFLLNDDIVKDFTARADTASQSITTGDNTLNNSAFIDLYGNQNYASLSADTLSALKDLSGGKLDAGLASTLESQGGGTLHVLYVTGDFYDINFVSQTNVVSNVDTVVQALPNTGTTTAPTGDPTTSTQSVDSGHNQLANVAGIAVVGTTSNVQLLGGQHYDDAILVQANLVTDTSKVTIGDTHTLAPEVIAFTGVHDLTPTPVDTPASTTTTTDPTVNHDLFHGVMT